MRHATPRRQAGPESSWRPGPALRPAPWPGLVLALSSTAGVIQLLSQQRALASPMGQATFAILMLQDLAVVPVLILVDLLARPS